MELLLKESLTKENFWNELYNQFPEGTKLFCDWIDEYKNKINWNKLFGEELKFHHMPYAIQLGIWLEFICDRGGCQFEIEDFFQFDLREEITGYIEHVLQFEAEGNIDD